MGQMGCSSAFVQHLLLSLGLFCCFLLGRVESYGHISMKIRVGILGLPNVGKSTLFNALAKKSIAEAANYPFCTIEPNIAPIPIPDPYLSKLGALAGSTRVVPATIEWVDVAGLARGAHRGEGLGNKFLATLRECDALCHVVRAFEDPDVTHVDGQVDPAADAEAVNLELLLADLAHVERRLSRADCAGAERAALQAVAEALARGAPARAAGLAPAAVRTLRALGLLTLKPVLYAVNADEADFAYGREEALGAARAALAGLEYGDPAGEAVVLVSARVEAELAAAAGDGLAALGLPPGEGEGEGGAPLCCGALPRAAAGLLGLATAYTGPGVPPERSRTTKAHLFRAGSLTAEGLAGRIHGAIEKGFVRAEVVAAPELLAAAGGGGGLAGAREAGRVRAEGRAYAVAAGDVVLVKWK